jgi:hypothetical protein
MVIGAVVEVIVFFSLLPKDSMQPPTTWQIVGEYTQAPFAWVASLFSVASDRLPSALLSTLAILILGIAFLTQVAVFALPIWVLITIVERRKKPPEDLSK